MKDSLTREYHRALILFLLFFTLILFGSLLYPFYRMSTAQMETNIERLVDKNRSYYELVIARKDEQVAALGSRTQIRLVLEQALDGAQSLETLQAFTQPRYRDGLAIYGNVMGAARYDAAGNLVASQGLILPYEPVGIDGTRYALHESADPNENLTLALEIRRPIVSDGRLLGQDAALFDVSSSIKEESGISYRLVDRLNLPPGVTETEWNLAGTSFPPIALAYRYPAALAKPSAWAIALMTLPFALTLLALVCVGAYITIYRGSRKLLSTYAVLAERRALLVRETNHRVKNNLNIIAGMVAVQIQKNGPSRALEDIQARVTLVGLVHDHLFRYEATEEVALKPYLADLGTAILSAQAETAAHPFDVSGAEIVTTGELCTGIGLIVSELMINALKYGLTPGDAVSVRLDALPDRWSLEFRNQGRPFPPDVDPLTSQSFGMELIRAYAKQFKGTVRFERSPDTRFVFAFPNPLKQ